jgi:hypothetical protein
MSLDTLKSAETLSDVANILGVRPQHLTYILYKMPDERKYVHFSIKKKYGGERLICAPALPLKFIQYRMATVLQTCIEEISKIEGRHNDISHGFLRRRSIISNAQKHRARRHVFNIDLHDFFGSINFGRVRGFFIADRGFLLRPKIATILAQIACYNNALPQGSPCSPVISHLIGHILDIYLVRLASRNGCTYSRYVDDLTFSTNASHFPEAIATKSSTSSNTWNVGRRLSAAITNCGFQVNVNKTRMQYYRSRQEVTGLIVNKSVNVRSEYRRLVRAMVHSVITNGQFFIPYCAEESPATSMVLGTPDQLQGMLSFIYHIDLYNARRNGSKETSVSSAKLSHYYRFLFFRYFFTAPEPLILCEGKTDNIYLYYAIMSLAADYNLLATCAADVAKLSVRFMRPHDSEVSEVLGITGGVGPLKKLISQYSFEARRFKSSGCANPVIIIFDNDNAGRSAVSGTKNVLGAVSLFGGRVIHVTHNLYILTIPHIASEDDTVIENLFNANTLGRRVNERGFCLEKKKSVTKGPSSDTYDKFTFARKVVREEWRSIDFCGFKPLLSLISDVIEYHAMHGRAPNCS